MCIFYPYSVNSVMSSNERGSDGNGSNSTHLADDRPVAQSRGALNLDPE